jgi:hypothetical protein
MSPVAVEEHGQRSPLCGINLVAARFEQEGEQGNRLRIADYLNDVDVWPDWRRTQTRLGERLLIREIRSRSRRKCRSRHLFGTQAWDDRPDLRRDTSFRRRTVALFGVSLSRNSEPIGATSPDCLLSLTLIIKEGLPPRRSTGLFSISSGGTEWDAVRAAVWYLWQPVPQGLAVRRGHADVTYATGIHDAEPNFPVCDGGIGCRKDEFVVEICNKPHPLYVNFHSMPPARRQ